MEWFDLKPCCVVIRGVLFVMYGRIVFSSVFAVTERSEMGLYEVPKFMSLFGFGIGMMFASFHTCGMMLLFSAKLYMWVRYVRPRGPMFFRCLMFSLSGPVELFVLLSFIASWTCVVVSVMFCLGNFRISLSIFLFVPFVVCFVVLTNCLLKQFAVCVCDAMGFSWNVMVLLFVGVGVLFERPCMVFQRMCVLCL